VVLHPKTEPLRELVKQLNAAPPFAKLTFAVKIAEDTISALGEVLHAVDKLEARVATLEQFPETRS
jgi:hypothetical protein